jgi:RNA polymerase sigma-70 factor (ECF subfamily)
MSAPQSEPSSAVRCDAGWFNEEIYPHEHSLRGYVKSAFPDVRDVDDVVQESFLKIWRRQAIAPVRSAKAFLFTVARNIALNTLRRQRRSPIIAVTDLNAFGVVSDESDVVESIAAAQRIELLVDAVDSLPARCREIFILRRLKGVPQKEIAARLGLSEQTVQVQAARGLRRCEEFVRRRLKSEA